MSEQIFMITVTVIIIIIIWCVGCAAAAQIIIKIIIRSVFIFV